MADVPTVAVPGWFSIGLIVAAIVAILAGLLWGLGRLPMEWALLVIAVCSHRF